MKHFYRPNYRIVRLWTKFWIRSGGLNPFGRFAMRMAALFTAPHKSRVRLAYLADSGYIAPSVIVDHDELTLGRHVFIDDGCILFKRQGTGKMVLADEVKVFRQVFMETGTGGSLFIDEKASIHPRCQINAFHSSIHIGKHVMLAPYCCLYSYNHGVKPGMLIVDQPLESKGPIVIGDGAWLGVGVIVTSGVTIGENAVVGAGSLVTRDIPPDSIAAGNPATVIKKRQDIPA
ncbi:acyltransferase [Desulfococcus sp.]|uniref:acyltransferase n=1 Tax=Desulfococcus sp. TaxID=2025834 RepID=UPI003D0FCA77